MSSSTDSKKKRTPSFYKMSDILDLVAKEKKVSFTKIHTTLNMAKSSAYAMITTMVEIGFLNANSDATLSLGGKLYELGLQVSANTELTQVAWPYLNKLREGTSLTVHLGIINGRNAFYLMKLDGYSSLIPNSWPGKKLSLHSSSLGKVLMAWKHETEIFQVMEDYNFEKKTPNTLTTLGDYLDALSTVKKQYCATDIGEDVVSLNCMAAPVFNYTNSVVAGLSFTSVEGELSDKDNEANLSLLKACAFELSKELGYAGSYGGGM